MFIGNTTGTGVEGQENSGADIGGHTEIICGDNRNNTWIKLTPHSRNIYTHGREYITVGLLLY